MAKFKYGTVEGLFEAICDACRDKGGTTDKIAHKDIPDYIRGLAGIDPSGEQYDTVDGLFTGICDACREACGTNLKIDHQDIPDFIRIIGVPLQYFAVYSEDDSSLTFYGDEDIPTVGTKYNGKIVTTVYEGVENTGTGNPPWYSDRLLFTTVTFDKYFIGAKPVRCYRWFYYFENLTTIDLKYLDTSETTTMGYMFHSCSNLTELDVSGLDTGNVTTMISMFQNCSGLTLLDVSNLNTTNVTNIAYMFYGCSGLTSIDISKINTINTTDMRSMFRYCSGLTTIFSDDNIFVTTAVTSGDLMFGSCSNLVGGNGTKYDSNNATYTMAHVDVPDNPGYFTAK